MQNDFSEQQPKTKRAKEKKTFFFLLEEKNEIKLKQKWNFETANVEAKMKSFFVIFNAMILRRFILFFFRFICLWSLHAVCTFLSLVNAVSFIRNQRSIILCCFAWLEEWEKLKNTEMTQKITQVFLPQKKYETKT